jgi:hypothetical protein
MGGLEEKHPRALALMKAQAAPAEYPEFKGNVAFVGTRSFWRTPEQSPGKQGYHWNQSAETYTLIGEGMGQAMLRLLQPAPAPARAGAAGPVKTGEMAGYLLVPQEKVPATFNAGFSMYVAAWPLLKTYPGNRMQTGLFGTWMFAQGDGPAPEKHYSDIEGGLGWWRDTRFATETPKFIMGGVAPDFVEWANGPGAGKGRDWNKPNGKYGVAQLSPWVLWPPDGLNLKQGGSGELFGYGYLPLPLTPAKASTGGKELPTGDQSWTLFVNAGNFKGPVAFFTPYFWSHVAEARPRLAGMLLDSRPSNPNRALQMETQHVPAVQSVDRRGDAYARIAPTRFPKGGDGNSVLVHRIASYTRKALWDGVKAWLDGGAPASGGFDPAESVLHVFTGKGGSSWRIYADGAAKEQRPGVAWASFAEPAALDPHTFGYRWKPEAVTPGEGLVTLPEYYRLGQDKAGKPQWVPVPAGEVPADTGLGDVAFERAKARRSEPYVTPEDPESCWKKPGPASGPFQAKLGDGSVVTYSWYRFVDQPTLLNADLSKEEREALQSRVEKIHRAWTKDRDYLPPPTAGGLADLDPALLVTPPAGMEAGFVPIVTRQEAP